MKGYGKALRHVRSLEIEAKKSNRRRIVVLAGEQEAILSFLAEVTKHRKSGLVVVDRDENGKEIAAFLQQVGYEQTSYLDLREKLGRTYESLVIDLRNNLNPDDLVLALETLSGGGVAFLLTPPIREWPWITRFHRELLVPGRSESELRLNFMRRFLERLQKAKGVSIIELFDSEAKLVKSGVIGVKGRKRTTPSLPRRSRLDLRSYAVCATKDQTRALRRLEHFWLKEEKRYFVLLSDRGRGKSALLGIFLAAILKLESKTRHSLRIALTSPSFEGLATLLDFLKLGLKRMGVRFEKEENKITVGGRLVVSWLPPPRVLERGYDLVVADEAAGIPLPTLRRYVENFHKVIFSTTSHGYEGSGRSFVVRFTKELESLGEEVEVVELREPIRYAQGDEVERLCFDTFLLDVEPPELERKDYLETGMKNYGYEAVDLEKLFENEKELREFFGINATAHYRFRPKDIAILAESPHHFARCVRTRSGRIIATLHLCEEGGLDESIIESELKQRRAAKGNVIPLVLLKHFRCGAIAKLRGVRIIRIAVHPEVQGIGIGSFAVEKLVEEAKGSGYDWVGVAFGATPRLLRFWNRLGFVPLHLSLERNPTSGEYSVICIRPISSQARQLVKEISYDFRMRLYSSIMDVHFDLDPETALSLFHTTFAEKPRTELQLTPMQLSRLKAYVDGILPYESAADAIRELVKYWLLDSSETRPELSELDAKLLILKLLLVKGWKRVSKLLGISRKEATRRMRSSIAKIYETYFNRRSQE